MTVLADVVARFRADTSDMDAGTQRMQQGLEGVSQSAGHMSSALGAAGLAVTGVLGLLVDKVAEATATYNTYNQQAMITFGALEGGASAARNQISVIDDLSVSLGQNREQLGDAAKYLQIMTEGVGNTTDSLTHLSNTASGLGIPVNQLAQQFGFLFEQMQQGGNNSAYAARALERSGAISREAVGQLKAMADAGASSDQMWQQLMTDLDKWNGAGEASLNTWTGVKKALKDTFEIDVGRAMEPMFESVNKFLNAIRKVMESEPVKKFAEGLSNDVANVASGLDNLTSHIENFAKTISGTDISTFMDKLKELSPLVGAVAGFLAKDTAELLSKMPIIKEFAAPLANVLDSGKGGLIGFLLASQQTREALMNLIGAVFELIGAVSKVAGPISEVLNLLVPVAATIINVAAAIVQFVAQNSVLIAMVKTFVELYLAMRLISAFTDFLAPILVSIGVTSEAVAGLEARFAGLGTVALAAAAAMLIGFNIVSDHINKQVSHGESTAAANIKTYVNAGSTTSLEDQATRVNQLSQMGEEQNRRNADAGGISIGGVRLGGDVDTQRDSAGQIKKIGAEYKDAMTQYSQMKENIASLSQQYGISQESVEAFAKVNKVDLTGSLKDVSEAFAQAEAAAGNYAKGAEMSAENIANLVGNMKNQLAGSMGQQSVNVGSMPGFSQAMDMLGKISSQAGTNGIPEWAKGTADNLRSQAAGMSGVNMETQAYIEQQSKALELQHAGIELGRQNEQALQGLKNAEFAYTQALFAEEQAQRAVFLAERDAFRAREQINLTTQELSRVMQTGISHDYFDLINKTHDLDGQGQAWLGTLLDQITVLNQQKDAMVMLQREYDSWNEQLTQVQDQMKTLQDIMNHPLEGSSSQSKAIEANKMAQDQIQMQMNALTLSRGGIQADPSADPVLGEMTRRLNQLKLEGQQLQLQQDATVGHENFLLNQTKQLSEVTFGVAQQAAKAYGDLNNRAADLTTTVDRLKGPLDAANYQYKVTNEVLAPQVQLIERLGSDMTQLPDKVNAVRTAHQQLEGAVNGVSNALFGVRQAHWAVDDQAFRSAQFRIQMLSHETDAANVLLGQVQALITAYGILTHAQQSGGIDPNAMYNLGGVVNIPGAALQRAATPGTPEHKLMYGFAEGGFVPGPVGMPLPAIVHGGEFVLSHQMLDDLAAGRTTFPNMAGSQSSTHFTIADGAVQVSILVEGNAPADLRDEVQDAVEESVSRIVNDLVAKGAH